MSSSQRRRRSRYEIIVAILKLCREPILKTQIMHQANLSFGQLNEYLDFLEERKLLAKKTVKKRTLRTVTKKGKKCIRAFERIQNLLKKEK